MAPRRPCRAAARAHVQRSGRAAWAERLWRCGAHAAAAQHAAPHVAWRAAARGGRRADQP
eukprot:scaffold99858_cov54-Phaeocystis_antarctica.AAC.1